MKRNPTGCEVVILRVDELELIGNALLERLWVQEKLPQTAGRAHEIRTIRRVLRMLASHGVEVL